MPDFSPMNELEGLQLLPLGPNKNPIPKGWQKTEKKHDISNCDMVGLACGKLSGGVMAIDFDLKYDTTGTLFKRYRERLAQENKNLALRMTVQETVGKGIHFIFRCSQLKGNEKLAMRPNTDEEKKALWNETYAASTAEGNSHEKATKTADDVVRKSKGKTLIETRGEGGQIVVAPSHGYKFVHGDLTSIFLIDPEEMDLLYSIAREFNEVVEEYVPPAKVKAEVKRDGKTPFDDYDDRGDVVSLLCAHGWKVVSNHGGKTKMLRPGSPTSKTSGDYDSKRNWFGVFSHNAHPFEVGKGYRPYAVYAMLECDGDFQKAVKKLYDEGYGDRLEDKPAKEKAQSTRVIQSRVNIEVVDNKYFATDADYDDYLHRVRTGTLEMGKTTGSSVLDEYFLFKQGNLVMVNGLDNVGKTKVVWYLALLSAMYHGWRWPIYASENTLGSFMRTMIQFFWGKPLYTVNGFGAVTESEFQYAKAFIKKHFKLIKAQEELFNYKDVLNLFRMARKISIDEGNGDFNCGMIDPYNSLKIDLSGFSKLSTHEYHYEAISEFKAYGQQTNFGHFMNLHAVTSAARAKDEDEYPKPPRKQDTEGGQKFPNKADDFLTVHRLLQHPEDWNVTQIHVTKIKETETGGKPTPQDQPVKFQMHRNQCGFRELTMLGLGDDPVQKWHRERKPDVQLDAFAKNGTPILGEKHDNLPF